MSGSPRHLSSDLVAHSDQIKFLALRDSLRTQLSPRSLDICNLLINSLPDWRRAGTFIDLGAPFKVALQVANKELTSSALIDVNRLLLSELVVKLPETLSQRPLSHDVGGLVASAASRLLTELSDSSKSNYSYPDDFFVKDLRFAAGLTVPAGAQVIDLRSSLGRRLSIQLLLRRFSMSNCVALLRTTTIDPWYRMHTEQRNLDEFNASGWNAFYRRSASMLKIDTDVRGLVGTSWFFDPQLKTISPRLAYLLEPTRHGAMLFPVGTSEFDISSATATSESRRKLYETGKYRPTSYTLIWPRDALLRWASNANQVEEST